MPNINVGLIGYGYAAKTFHAPLIANCNGLQLSAISSRHADKVLHDYPQVSVFSDPIALIESDQIELVVIASPNDTHFELARQALLMGKHVVVDKPFTLTLVQAESLSNLACEQNRLLSVFHNRRWDSDFLTLQNLLADDLIGRVVYFESHFDRFRPTVIDRWREKKGQGTGLWYDLAPHLIDQALQLFAMPDSIYCDMAILRTGAEVDDYFHAILSYPDKRVILHASMLVAEACPRFVVHGSSGSYYKYGLDPQEQQLKQGVSPSAPQFGNDHNDGLLTQYDQQRLINKNIATRKGDYLNFYQQMALAITEGGTPPVTAQQAIDVMRILELGIQSAQQQCAIRLNNKQD